MCGDRTKQLLADCIIHVEDAILEYARGNSSKSKEEYLNAVKQLNQVSRTVLEQPFKDATEKLSQYVLQLVERIRNDDLKVSEKLLWVISRTENGIFPPVIRISRTIDSSNCIFIPEIMTADLISARRIKRPLLPPNLQANYRSILPLTWDFELEDLRELYQDVLNNCSVVSSFLSIAYLNVWKCLEDIIEPHEPSDVYKCKLYFNGCRRCVTIDNNLPVMREANRNLVVKSSRNEKMVWPAFIEKACLSLLGNSYDFKGSNMANDTYALTGWIPEIKSIKEKEYSTDFETIWKSFLEGEVLLGLGTGKLSESMSQKLGLLPQHDYAVVRYDKETKLVGIVNPWKGSNEEADRMTFLNVRDLYRFSFFYVNWDANSLFKYRTSTCFYHDGSNLERFFFDVFPQFTIQNSASSKHEIWFLLECHSLASRTSVEELHAMDIYRSKQGERIISPNEYLGTLRFETNNKFLLTRIEMEPGSFVTLAILDRFKSSYTLHAFHNIDKELVFHKAKYLNKEAIPMIEDEWNYHNNGGNWSHASFIDNPQYDLEVKSTTDIQIGVISVKEGIHVNVHIFVSEPQYKGLAIRKFDSTKLVYSERYNPNFHFHHLKSLKSGTYKMVISSYVPDTSKFRIFAWYSKENALIISKINSKLALFNKEFYVDWSNLNRFKFVLGVIYPYEKIIIHAVHGSQDNKSFSYRPAIRASIFDRESLSPVLINEDWSRDTFGVYLDFTPLKSGEYILLVERFEQGVGRCKIELGCNKEFNVPDHVNIT